MENATDALKMAGAVLLFVLAISVAIVSFGQVRETADTILNYKDRETTYEYIDEDTTEALGLGRKVSLETAIPSIFRAYLENYKIVFVGLNEPIYTIKISGQDTGIDKYTLDLETSTEYKNVVLANEEQKSEFLYGILYHKFKENQTEFEKKFNITLPSDSLYNRLTNKTMIEHLGVYYQDDSENTPDVNKTKKRIITYVIQ